MHASRATVQLQQEYLVFHGHADDGKNAAEWLIDIRARNAAMQRS